MGKKRPSSDLRFCSCQMCRYGRGGGKNSTVREARHAYRHKVKQTLHEAVKNGDYDIDIPPRHGVVYTD